MPSLFKRIRKSLLKNGNISKYLTYAFGEIFLVMIGILLALQVNNWNEQRKSDDMMQNRIRALVSDLEHNIHEANAIIDFADTYDSIFDRVISKTDQNSAIADFTTLLGTQTANFYKESLAAVLENEEKLPVRYIALIPDLKGLNRLFRSQEKWEDITLEDREDITKNVIYTEDYDFTSLDQEEAIQEFEKLITSNQFRNRVLLSYGNTLLVENAWDVTQIRATSLILLLKLKWLLHERKPISAEHFFQENGLVPFLSFDCNTKPKSSKYEENFGSYRMAFPFYNATKEVRHIDFLDAAFHTYKTISLEPGAFHFNEYELYDEDLFRIRDMSGCLGSFQSVRNGYMVITD